MAGPNQAAYPGPVLPRGEVTKIEVQREEDKNDKLSVDVAWMAQRYGGGEWQPAKWEHRGEWHEIVFYEAELESPRVKEPGLGCFSIVLTSAEQVVTFYEKGQVNWIDPSTLPWLQTAQL